MLLFVTAVPSLSRNRLTYLVPSVRAGTRGGRSKRGVQRETTVAQPLPGIVNCSFFPAAATVIVRAAPAL